MEDISNEDIEILRQIKILHRSCIDLGLLILKRYFSKSFYLSQKMFLASWFCTESIELAGVKPLVDLLEKYHKNEVSLAKMLAKIRRDTGQSYIFDMTIESSYQNTSLKQIFVNILQR